MKKKLFIKKIKGIFYFFLFYSGIFSFIFFLFKKIKKKHHAAILLYHRIVVKNSGDYLFKNPSVHHDAHDFQEEIKFISKWFKVISLDQLTYHIKNNIDFYEPSLVITFDDGYRDNYTFAYQILKKYALPATIYLTTGLIGTHGRTWPDDIEYALLNTKKNTLSFPELLEKEVIDISTLEKKRIANNRIAKKLKLIDNYKKLELMAALFQQLGVEYDASSREKRMLNWEEVMTMDKNNITFGAHTVTHPILSKISANDAQREIISSKNAIQEKAGIKVKHFAIPNGGMNDFSEDLKRFCSNNGFETITTTEHGYVDNTSDPYFLRRIMPNVPIYFFAGELIKLFFFSKRYQKNGGVYGTHDRLQL